MPDIPTLLAFTLAAALLIVAPGPNVIYIITRGIDQGRQAAVVSVLGVETGMLFHIGAAVLGLSALVARSELVFTGVKYAGAAYLVGMGIASIPAKGRALETSPGGSRAGLGRLYTQGLVVNVLNPKVGLFFVAFLPQFIDPGRGGATAQILVLGGVFLAVAVLIDMMYAVASGAIGSWLGERDQLARQRDRFTGIVFILLGAFAAVTGSSTARQG